VKEALALSTGRGFYFVERSLGVARSTKNAMFQKRGLSNAKQVVIHPHLRRVGVVIFDDCAGVSISVGWTATNRSSHHVGAPRLRIRLPLGGVRLHS
jgi:hypothetical protein